MRRFVLGVALLLAIGPARAGTGRAALKTAEVSQKRWELSSEAGQLEKAADAFAQAASDPAVAKSAKTWLVGGDIGRSIAMAHSRAARAGLSTVDLPPLERGGLAAADAYEKALTLEPKKVEAKSAGEGLRRVQALLLEEATRLFDLDRDYAAAVTRYERVLVIHQALKEAGEASALEDDAAVGSVRLALGVAAWTGGDDALAVRILSELEGEGETVPLVYEALYQASLQTDPDAARAWLEKGREKYPDEVGLLFAEINDLLRRGEHERLLERLDDAIAKEPKNANLYAVAGTVHEKLADARREQGDPKGAAAHLADADTMLRKGLEQDPDAVDIYVALGSLHFNLAARLGATLADLDDSTAEGRAKYDGVSTAVLDEMNVALPWFQEAERRAPNDPTVLQALKTIYANTGDLALSKEFAGRLETVLSGGTNTSYFAK